MPRHIRVRPLDLYDPYERLMDLARRRTDDARRHPARLPDLRDARR